MEKELRQAKEALRQAKEVLRQAEKERMEEIMDLQTLIALKRSSKERNCGCSIF